MHQKGPIKIPKNNAIKSISYQIASTRVQQLEICGNGHKWSVSYKLPHHNINNDHNSDYFNRVII